MLFREVLSELLDHQGDILWLDRDEHNVGVLNDLRQADWRIDLMTVGATAIEAALTWNYEQQLKACLGAGVRSIRTEVLENLLALLTDVSRPYILCCYFLLRDKTLRESFGHIAGSYEPNFLPNIFGRHGARNTSRKESKDVETQFPMINTQIAALENGQSG